MQTTSMSRQLIAFSIPLILSGLLQQMFNWADAFIVGNIVGENALAAVGSTLYVTSLFVMAITGFTSGVSILAAQMFGEGNLRDQKKVLFTFLMVVGGAFLVLSGFGIGCARPALRAMDTPADIFGMAWDYLRIVLLGIPFLAIYNVYAAVLRGIGDSRSPFWAVMVSVIVNVIMDVLLVAVLGMGVAGAALATVASQAMMALFMVVYTGKAHPVLRFRGETALFDRAILTAGSRLAAPITIQSLVNSAGGLVLQRIMNSFGTATVAAISTAYRVDSVILLPIFNLGTGISTLTAQNTGAGDHQRAKKCLYVGCGLMAAVSVVLTAVVIAFGGPLIALFGVTAEAVLIGERFFRSIAVFYIINGWAMAFRGYLEGTGDVGFSGITGIVSLAVRIAFSYALVGVFDNMVIAYAEAFAWCFMLLLFVLRFVWRQGRRKECAR